MEAAATESYAASCFSQGYGVADVCVRYEESGDFSSPPYDDSSSQPVEEAVGEDGIETSDDDMTR